MRCVCLSLHALKLALLCFIVVQVSERLQRLAQQFAGLQGDYCAVTGKPALLPCAISLCFVVWKECCTGSDVLCRDLESFTPLVLLLAVLLAVTVACNS